MFVISMRRLASLLMLIAFCAPSQAASLDPVGSWLTEDGRARVRTEHCGDHGSRLCGYVVWLDKPLDETGKPKLDASNTDPRKRARPILGHEMILALRLGEDGRYEGKIYNADNGKLYDVSVWREQEGDLQVRGCLVAPLCMTQTWSKVDGIAPGELKGLVDALNGPHSDPE